MSGKLAPSRAAAKSAGFPKRNEDCTTGNQLSAAMQAVKDLLPAEKAWHLHAKTGAGLSTCQKVLSGHRRENLEMFLALLRSEYGWEILRAAMAEGEEQPWFEDILALVDINKLKQDHARMKRDLDRREQRLIEAKAGARR